MSGPRTSRPKASRRRPGILRVAGWLVLLLAALSFVTWRQPRAVAMEQSLRSVESAVGIAEAERLAAVRRLEELRSRARIVRVADEELGMHLPEGDEIVFLPLDVQ